MDFWISFVIGSLVGSLLGYLFRDHIRIIIRFTPIEKQSIPISPYWDKDKPDTK